MTGFEEKGKFWIVRLAERLAENPPILIRHYQYAQARNEAEILAKQNPGTNFVILEAVAVSGVYQPQVETRILGS